MKLSNISNMIFEGKIIDSHGHIGNWRDGAGKLYDASSDLDIFVKTQLKNGDTVEKIIVSNLDCMVNKSEKGVFEVFSDEIAGNRKMIEVCSKNPKFSPLAVCQPGIGNVNNIKKLLDENHNIFAGFKFHPEQLNIPANSDVYKPYLKLASERNLPCLFHSGNTFDVHYPDGGISKASKVSRPEQIYQMARNYKDVPVILAHWGGDGEANYNKTTDLIIESLHKKDAKLYGDISWVDCNNSEKPNLKRIIERLKSEKNGLDRIIFGTDAPLGRFGGKGEQGLAPIEAYTNNIDDIKRMIKKEFPDDAEKIIDKIFYENANNLFFSKKESEASKFSAKNILTGVVAAVLLLATATGVYFYNKNKKAEMKNNENTEVQKLNFKV